MGARGSKEIDSVSVSKLSSEELGAMKMGFERLCSTPQSANIAQKGDKASDVLKSGCGDKEFAKHVESCWEPSLADNVVNNLGLKRTSDGSISFKEFQTFGARLVTKSHEDKARIVIQMAENRSSGEAGNAGITVKDLKEFVVKLFKSFMIERAARKETSWFDSEAGLQQFADSLARSTGKEDHQKLSQEEVQQWLAANPLALRLLETVFRTFLFLPLPDPSIQPGLIPSCEHPYLPKARFPTLLGLPSVALINSELPVELRSEWRFLYSSYLLGDSFTGLVNAIVGKGPSIIVVKERGTDEVFGGFAPLSWSFSSNWQGTSNAFLFTLKPKVGIYRTTGYNDHYMYLNLSQETLPNGLGMGGQHEYFALWLDADYGKGYAAPSCTTYQSPPLCSTERFAIDCIEVWGVGPEPDKREERGSILDADPGAQALLEMTGRTAHSAGMRENATSGSPETKRLHDPNTQNE